MGRGRVGHGRSAAAAALAAILIAGCTEAPAPDPAPAVTTPAVTSTVTSTPASEPPAEPGFTSRVLATDLAGPWEITWGPDSQLWVTEKSAGRVTRVSPVNGAKRTALTLADVLVTDGTQDGLLGLALHPGLLKPGPNQYVYLAYTYDANPAAALDRRAKIVRYTYDPRTQALASGADVLTGLPASVDHNSGRLVFGPDQKLYYTIGDQGGNQFDLYCQPIRSRDLPTAAQVRAKDWSTYQGKILRLNLDGSVPTDNPNLRGVRSHVYSYGHRNAQGLAFGPGDRLYSTEHGPKSDDELNRIDAGRDYGWPRVVGARDDKAYVYGNWSAARGGCANVSYSDFAIPEAVPQEKESTFTDAAFTPPLRTFYTVGSDHEFRDPKCAQGGRYFICWPTIAPSSLDVYAATGVPGWAPSLLVPSLKDGLVYRLKLGPDGNPTGEASPLWRSVNRYRDTAISADGKTVYVATDVSGLTRDRSGAPTFRLANPGTILEFRHTG